MEESLAPAYRLGFRDFENVNRSLDDVLKDCHVLPKVEALKNHAELGADSLDLAGIGGH